MWSDKFLPILFAGCTAVCLAGDPTVQGRWRLDLDASKVQDPSQNQTLWFEKSGTKFRLTADTNEPNRAEKLIVPCDGKSHHENNAMGAVCKVKDGKKLYLTGTGTESNGELSADGNSLMVTRTGPNGVAEKLVYRRESF